MKERVLEGIDKLIAHAIELNKEYYARNGFTFALPEFKVIMGRKYAKVVRDTSAYVFVDLTTGDVLKPASWKAPAKGVRGNVLEGKYGITAISAVYNN